jgi:hypothetical protein
VKGVVPVAADVHPGLGGEIAGGQPDVGRVGELTGQDRSLQDGGDLALLLEQLCTLDGQGALARHGGQEAPLFRLEAPFLGPGQ